ncbi:porin family protein [Chitinophaga pollutisoli]|uniref:Porin family protein n=1 Tax=Chitinophaga pollutisoli TaxID=3133966 RepID=A0ABZ2YGT7_9BACT
MSEQFEHNIRKKLQDAEVPFEPQAWDRMEKLLDQPRNRRPMWWWFGGLAIILGLGGWWWFTRPASYNFSSSPKTENSASTTVPENDVENGSPDKNAIPEEDNKLNVDKPDGATISESNNTEKSSRKAIIPIFKESDAVNKSPANSERNKDVNEQANASILSFHKTTTNETIKTGVDKPIAPSVLTFQKSKLEDERRKDVDKTVSTAPLSSQKDKNALHVPASVDNPSLPPATSDKNHAPNTSAPTPVNNSANPAVPDTNTVKEFSNETWKAPRRKGFDGGIHLGPDVNATGSLTGLRAGFTGGLLIRYHVNNKWYLSTGAAYTKKLYQASPKEYNSPYPGNYVDIDADCDVIDVPLQVHYVFAENPSGRWNVSVGASTYFMLREKYDYYYPNNYKRTRVFSNQNQHWFSVINISAGWEKNTKGRLNWGLHPYLKIPAGGVGEGKVKLYSAGLSLQLTMGKK